MIDHGVQLGSECLSSLVDEEAVDGSGGGDEIVNKSRSKRGDATVHVTLCLVVPGDKRFKKISKRRYKNTVHINNRTPKNIQKFVLKRMIQEKDDQKEEMPLILEKLLPRE